MSTTNIRDVVSQLRDYFFRYYETAFAIRDEDVARERRDLLEAPGSIFQEPYLEVLPEFATADDSMAEICRAAGAHTPRSFSPIFMR